MHLEALLQNQRIPYRKSYHARTYTAQELAQAEHVSGYNVAKPVVVKSPAGFTMCVLSACDHLDLTCVADVLNEDEVRLAAEQEMEKLFPGCEVGAEPPVGVLFGLRTIMDERLHNDEFLVMQAGRHTEAIQVRRDDWERLCEPRVARIAHRL